VVRIPDDLKGARVNLVETASLLGMHVGHLQRLIRRGVFPQPKRTAKGLPFFDHGLLLRTTHILKTGVGLNKEEIMFHRRRQKPKEPGKSKPQADPYLQQLSEGLLQVGVPESAIAADKLIDLLAAEFGTNRPELAVAIAVLAQKLME